MPTIQAKDLTKEFPRSPFEELAGLPWLARMIDKVRALNAGMIGEYTPFPCGGDQNFLRTIGIEPDAIKDVITSGASDEEIGRWVKAHVRPDLEIHLNTYRQSQHAPLEGEMANYLAHAKEELAKARPDLDVSGVKNWAQLICLEEGHKLP